MTNPLKLSLILIFFMAISAFAQLESQLNYKSLGNVLKKSEFEPIFESKYTTLNSRQNKGSLFALSLRMDMSYGISENLQFEFDGGASFEKGNSNSLFNNSPIEPSSQLVFRRAEFVYRPAREITFKAGAIGTREVDQPILLGRGAFLGTKQQFVKEIDKFTFELSAMQTIPNNMNYSNRLDEVDEGDPRFYYEEVKLTYGDVHEEDEKRFNDGNFISAKLGHFAFDSLSNSVADYSRFIGNSVNTFSDRQGDSEFIFSYQGWSQKYSAQFKLTKYIRVTTDFGLIENTAAPIDNKGSYFRFKPIYNFGDVEYSLGYSNFEVERDATVGFYQPRSFFNVNHRGESYEFKYHDLRSDLVVQATYGRMNEININQIAQRDSMETFVLMIRKFYEI